MDTTLAGDSPALVLRNLGVAIGTVTPATAGSNSSTWTSTNDLVKLAGLELQLDCEPADERLMGEISRNLSKDSIVSGVTPSFTTCIVVRQDFLMITAGL